MGSPKRAPGVDLGTYHLIVRFEDGRGYVQKWETGGRFVPGGTEEFTPLSQANDYGPTTWLPPIYADEADLIASALFMYTEGNYSCSCNRALFLARALQREEEDRDCGDSIVLASIDLVRPDGSHRRIFPAGDLR